MTEHKVQKPRKDMEQAKSFLNMKLKLKTFP